MRARSTHGELATAADRAACRELLRDGSRTFAASARLLPPAVRAPATALYAFCRLADDAVDLGAERGDAALAQLASRLDRIYERRPLPIAADLAFADVVASYHIPKSLPAALLEGFAWDVAGRRYRTLAELEAYAARVAGTVGAMMALLMGAREASVLARACDLGIAMQLTNIARDVGEDARAGRLYLPLDWLREAGIRPDRWLTSPAFRPELALVVARLLREADERYERAAHGIQRLPLPYRAAMHAARLMYAEIGREVERCGYDSVSRRAVVPRIRKAACAGAALRAMLARATAAAEAPPCVATRSLVEAAARAGSRADGTRVRGGVEDRVIWVLDLFERLERRERAGAGATHGAVS